MASTFNAALCAAGALLLWTSLGLAIARRLAPFPLALPLAPLIGWSVHSVTALPVFFYLPFTATTVAVVAAVALLASIAAERATRPPKPCDATRIPAWAYAAAAVLAMAPAVAIVPKYVGDAVILADPIFDHAKVALIDEMTRLGLPPGNPFFGGGATRLAYYYLWHFSAAELALLLGVSGWEADIAMTWFSAFASLVLMMGLAAWFSGRVSAAAWVVVLAAAASGRLLVSGLVDEDTMDAVLEPAAGFGGWLFQSAWAPQHITSASCVVLSIYLISRMVSRRSGLLVATTALVVVAGFESSTWVGGVAFALSALIGVPVLLMRAGPDQRPRFIFALAVTGLAAACLAAPFLHDQLAVAALRGGEAPVAFHPYDVLSDDLPDDVRTLLDVPAFWLVLLVLEFPAIYVTGSIVLAKLVVARGLDRERMLVVSAFAALVGTCLTISWLLTSTVGENNDLGWRAILPPVIVLTVFSAVGISQWIARRTRVATIAALAAVLVGLPEGVGLVCGNVVGRFQAEGYAFAETPEMWARVRQHAAADERVGGNPLFLQTMTLWPVNISWSLLANRRSCFAGRELALVFIPLPQPQREAIDDQFIRVFAGQALPGDIKDLATQYDCRLIVLTSTDAAWGNDPFAASPFYRLVDEKPGHWRLYRTTQAAN